MLGQCYHYALETLFDLHARLSSGTVTIGNNGCVFESSAPSGSLHFPELGNEPLLVHGFIVGRSGELKGVKFGHAWLEGNGYVVDCGSMRKEHNAVRRERYYDFWQVKDEECQRYTVQQATERILATGSITGWHPAPEDAVTPDRLQAFGGAGSASQLKRARAQMS
jgi:hypothetical protein